MSSRLLQRMLGPFREFGLWGGFLYSANRVLNGLSPHLRLYYHYWMVQPITAKPLLPEQFIGQMSIRHIEHGDPLLDLMPVPPETLLFRFRQSAQCLALFIKDEFAGYIWFTYGRYDEDEARCTFVLSPERESVFDFDLYLFPKYRAGIAFSALWDFTSRYLRERGIRYSYSRMTAFKLNSAKSHSHLGMRRIGSAVVLRIGALETIFASQPPYIFVSLKDSSRLPIKLAPDVLADSGAAS